MKIARKILVSLAMMIGIGVLIYVPTNAVFSESPKPAQAGAQVFASEPVAAAVSIPVQDIPHREPEQTLNREINPIRNPGLFSSDLGLTGSNTKSQDPLVELSHMDTGLTPNPTFTFEGLGTDGYTPPDTMGEVGPNHYVQMVNVSFAIYDKSGNILTPDTAFNDLYTGSGLSACENQNDGDPVVLWDSMADRWLLSQFAVSSSPYHMCIAISQTPDPTGAYYLYEFEVPDFPDYFKFGVWPDAYYMGSNTGYPNQYYAYAFDRAAMLAGQPATYQYSNGHPNFPLPADLDGPVPPQIDTPGYFYTMLAEGYVNHPPGVDRVVLYEFDVDWDTPANSTYGIAQEIPITDYNYTTCGFFAGDCIPQPDTTQRLDSVDPWPMWRFAYRNLGSYEALVGNFTVDTNGSDHAGIRWFELQKSGASWNLHQEGTHAPDSDHRWMGSIAMDGSGNIALGYSISSDTTYPSLRYATRLTGDPLGTLQAEATLYAGGGSQTGPYDRWGDYSSMSIDPADECTFWYTGEYHDITDESFNWNTRIGTFRIPECTGSLGPDFAISAAPNTQEICAPDDAIYDVTVNFMSGFDGEVTFSTANLPASATAAFVPTSVTTPTTNSVLTIGTTGVAAGSYNIDIVGIHVPTPTHTTTVGLDLFTASPTVPNLTTPSNGATNVSIPTAMGWDAVDQAQSYTFEIATDVNFTSVVYTETVETTSLTIPDDGTLDTNTHYYWRVQAHNGCGDSDISQVFIFTTEPAPGDCTTGTSPVTQFEDAFESGAVGWTHGGTGDTWQLSTVRVNSGSYAYHAEDVSSISDQYLVSPEVVLPTSQSPLTLQFWNHQTIEDSDTGCFDGAILEISTDSGISWTQLDAELMTDPYDGIVSSSFGNTLAELNAWCGDPQDWLNSIADLDAYAGQSVQFRFRLGTDSSINREGWYVDDVVVQSCQPDLEDFFIYLPNIMKP